jgi:hypothetical protein
MRTKKIFCFFMAFVFAITLCCSAGLAEQEAQRPPDDAGTKKVYALGGWTAAFLFRVLGLQSGDDAGSEDVGNRGFRVLLECEDGTWNPTDVKEAEADLAAMSAWLEDFRVGFAANMAGNMAIASGAGSEIETEYESDGVTSLWRVILPYPRIAPDAVEEFTFARREELPPPKTQTPLSDQQSESPAAFVDDWDLAEKPKGPGAFLAETWIRNGWMGSISGPIQTST